MKSTFLSSSFWFGIGRRHDLDDVVPGISRIGAGSFRSGVSMLASRYREGAGRTWFSWQAVEAAVVGYGQLDAGGRGGGVVSCRSHFRRWVRIFCFASDQLDRRSTQPSPRYAGLVVLARGQARSFASRVLA
jgi:hypothetical protein